VQSAKCAVCDSVQCMQGVCGKFNVGCARSAARAVCSVQCAMRAVHRE